MPLVTLHMHPGRTPAQKRGAVQGITEALVTHLGVKPASVEVILIEVPREHWGFGALPEPPAPAAT